MCDNNKNSKTKCVPQEKNKCAPCINDNIGCQYSNINHVIANNMNIMNCYKNIKCQILAYINSLSVEFVQNVDVNEVPLERSRLNTLIENLISGIHQSVRSYTNGQLEPYFQLWIQKEIDPPAQPGSCSNTTYKNKTECEANSGTWTPYQPAGKSFSLGTGWIDGEIKSGCYNSNGEGEPGETYATCESNGYIWNGTENDTQYDEGNRTKLYPNKISLLVDCNKNGVAGDEVIYLYIPSIQLLYNPLDSSLDLKWGDVDISKNPIVRGTCLFPVITNDQSFKSVVLHIVPPSYDAISENENTEIWDTQANLYKFIKNDLLLENTDLHNLLGKLDHIIRQCELANTSLLLKRRIEKLGL